MGDWRSGSAGALQAQGRGFKSLIAHHMNSRAEADCFGFFFFGRFRALCVMREGLFMPCVRGAPTRSGAKRIAARFAPEKSLEFGRIP